MADNKHSVQIIIAVIGLVGVLGAALISQWDKIVPKTDKRISDPVDSISKTNDTGKASADTATQTGNNPIVQKFEDKLIALVDDSRDCFNANRENDLGYRNYGGQVNCMLYTPKLKLSEINSDTIYYYPNKICQYRSVITEGNDSIAIRNKFNLYRLKISYALPPDFEEKETGQWDVSFKKDNTLVGIIFNKARGKYGILLIIAQN